MKKYIPLFLIVIAALCFYCASVYSKYEFLGVVGFILVFISIAIFSALNKKVSPKSTEKVPVKGINKGLLILIVSTVIEMSLLGFSFSGDHTILGWIAFFSIPTYFIVFLVGLSLMS
jgi:quinol-cytochrome oxidoreductase complex cytochrome b subunit